MREVLMSIFSDVIAGVILYYITKELDKNNTGNGNK